MGYAKRSDLVAGRTLWRAVVPQPNVGDTKPRAQCYPIFIRSRPFMYRYQFSNMDKPTEYEAVLIGFKSIHPDYRMLRRTPEEARMEERYSVESLGLGNKYRRHGVLYRSFTSKRSAERWVARMNAMHFSKWEQAEWDDYVDDAEMWAQHDRYLSRQYDDYDFDDMLGQDGAVYSDLPDQDSGAFDSHDLDSPPSQSYDFADPDPVEEEPEEEDFSDLEKKAGKRAKQLARTRL